MKKQVLVTVDRGETRVAMLEAAGDPAAAPTKSAGSRRRKKKPDVPLWQWGLLVIVFGLVANVATGLLLQNVAAAPPG